MYLHLYIKPHTHFKSSDTYGDQKAIVSISTVGG